MKHAEQTIADLEAQLIEYYAKFNLSNLEPPVNRKTLAMTHFFRCFSHKIRELFMFLS